MPGAHDHPDPCSAALSRLQEHLDHELDAGTARQIAEHLEACPPCDDEAEAWRALKDALRRYACGVDETTVERLRALCRSLTER